MCANVARSALEKHVFEPDGARLIKAINVTCLDKKRKPYSLCLSIGNDRTASISVVKRIDKHLFRRKFAWSLKELHKVDGKDATRDCTLLDLHFDKVFRWSASTPLERNVFIANLWMMYTKQQTMKESVKTPPFINVPDDLLQPALNEQQQHNCNANQNSNSNDIATEDSVKTDCGGADGDDADSGVLSAQEEGDLLLMMSECDTAAQNAESFVSLLSRDLSVLDGANVQSIMASERQVESLISVVQAAINELESVELRLAAYDSALLLVRRSLHEMEREKSKLQLTHSNQKQLLSTLEQLLPELSHKQRQILSYPDLTTLNGVKEACAAANALRTLSSSPPSACTDEHNSTADNLHKMAAVVEQRHLFDKLRTRFSRTVSRHLANLLVHMGNDTGSVDSDLRLPDHTERHDKLLPYTDLIHWTRSVDNKTYEELLAVYETSMSKRYEQELCELFTTGSLVTGVDISRKDTVSEGTAAAAGGGGVVAVVSGTLSRVPSQLRRPSSVPGSQSTVGSVLLTGDSDSWASMSDEIRLRFDKVLVQILSCLHPAFQHELHFCSRFFQLPLIAAKDSVSVCDSGDSVSMTSSSTGGTTAAESDSHCRLSQLMSALFAALRSNLTNFLTAHERADPLCTMHILVRVSECVTAVCPPARGAVSENTGLLQRIFLATLISSKQNLDRYMHAHIEAIERYSAAAGTSVVRRTRCGILPFVENFEHLLKITDSVFGGSARYSDWQRWCVRLLHAIVNKITVIGEQHPKTPLQVVLMENLHHLHAMLMRVKVAALDSERRDLKLKYSQALKAYVARYFGQPLIKLNQFFDGVQQCVSQGVKQSEVGYQLAFSKQQLRRVLHEYPGREVKKGLEQLYKKVDKHLCPEENLLQVVWRAIQEEFLTQYKSLETMIQCCYPGSMITLDFSIDDLLAYFSEIARQH